MTDKERRITYRAMIRWALELVSTMENGTNSTRHFRSADLEDWAVERFSDVRFVEAGSLLQLLNDAAGAILRSDWKERHAVGDCVAVVGEDDDAD